MTISNLKRTNAPLDEQLKAGAEEIMGEAASDVAGLVREIPMDSPNGRHIHWAGMPNEREWDGERVVKGLELEHKPFTCRPRENTVGVDLDVYNSAPYAQLLNMVTDVISQMPRTADREVVRVLENGKSADSRYLGPDGVALFSNAHPRNDGTVQENLLTSKALTKDNFIEAYETMLGFTDAEGRKLKIKPTTLIVPSQLTLAARDVLKEIDDAGATNILAALNINVVVLPEFESATDWYLASGAPFTHYVYKQPEFMILSDPSLPNVFYHRKVLMGYDASYETLPSLWQLLLKCEA